MIQPADYSKTAALAYDEALAFLRQIGTARGFLAAPSNPNTMPRTTALNHFVTRRHSCAVYPFRNLPKPEFASWLFSTGDGRMAIAVDNKQIDAWTKVSTLSRDVQMARSVVHELGHFHLSESLRQGRQPGGYTSAATAAEEEKAWIFCFAFFAVLMGSYAREGRGAPHFCDDAPKVVF